MSRTSHRLFRLRTALTRGVLQGTDRDSLRKLVVEAVPLRGANLWMLGFSSIIACIGLDTGSTAVIIGAMLISPLMGPILGSGFSLAVHDRPLLRISLIHFGQAVLLTLLIATLYFLVTPLGEPTAELLARTRPSLLDAAIAFFGGAAGILAQSRKSPSSAIPGVAIATALMPPLCTVGAGIAMASLRTSLGALYLFVLNAAFIALATYLAVRLLRFPVLRPVDPSERRRREWQFALLFLVLLVPGSVLLYREWDGLHWQRLARRAVHAALTNNGCDVVSWKLQKDGERRWLRVYAASDSSPGYWQRRLDSATRAVGASFGPSRVACIGERSHERDGQLESSFSELAADAVHREFSRRERSEDARVHAAANELSLLWPGIRLVGAGSLGSASGRSFATALVEVDSPAVLDSVRVHALADFLRSRLETDTLPRILTTWRPAPVPPPPPPSIRSERQHSSRRQHR